MPYANTREIVQAWIATLNRGDLEAALALYAPQARLLPTFTPHTLEQDAKRRAYFHTLLQRPGMNVMLHEKTLHVHPAGGTIEIASGIYRFQFAIDDEPLVFEARFTLVVDLSKEAPILHHHSSQIPRTLS